MVPTALVTFGDTKNESSLHRTTERVNGTGWTANPDELETARQGLAGAGTQTVGLAFGGGSPNTAATEESTPPDNPKMTLSFPILALSSFTVDSTN